jgi:hypothetical protein
LRNSAIDHLKSTTGMEYLERKVPEVWVNLIKSCDLQLKEGRNWNPRAQNSTI